MKKIFLTSLLVLSMLLIGCSDFNISKQEKEEVKAVFIKDKDVKNFEKELLQLAKEEISNHFQKNIHEKQFDVSYSEQKKENEFIAISSVDTKNNIYVHGTYKGKPNNIIEFIMIYNNEDQKIDDLRILTTEEEDFIPADL